MCPRRVTDRAVLIFIGQIRISRSASIKTVINAIGISSMPINIRAEKMQAKR